MEKLNILIIEDDEDHAFLEEDILLDELECEVRIISSKKELQADYIKNSDVVLLDFNLPDSTGKDILKMIRHESDIPVVIITGDDQVETAVGSLKNGASDFLVKSPQNITLLPQVVKRLREEYLTKKMLEKEKENKEKLEIRIETLRQVLTTLAHYINNSTTTIYGYAQLCEQNTIENSKCDKLIQISIRETKKISLVLKELENFVESMNIKTTKYVNIPDAMFAIEDNIQQKMKDIEKKSPN